LRVIDHGKEDRDRIRVAYLEESSNLWPLAAVVMHGAQHVAHGCRLAGRPVHQSVDDFAALGIVNGFQR